MLRVFRVSVVVTIKLHIWIWIPFNQWPEASAPHFPHPTRPVRRPPRSIPSFGYSVAASASAASDVAEWGAWSFARVARLPSERASECSGCPFLGLTGDEVLQHRTQGVVHPHREEEVHEKVAVSVREGRVFPGGASGGRWRFEGAFFGNAQHGRCLLVDKLKTVDNWLRRSSLCDFVAVNRAKSMAFWIIVPFSESDPRGGVPFGSFSRRTCFARASMMMMMIGGPFCDWFCAFRKRRFFFRKGFLRSFEVPLTARPWVPDSLLWKPSFEDACTWIKKFLCIVDVYFAKLGFRLILVTSMEFWNFWKSILRKLLITCKLRELHKKSGPPNNFFKLVLDVNVEFWNFLITLICRNYDHV